MAYGCECVGYQAHDREGHEHPNDTLNKPVNFFRFTGRIDSIGVFVPQNPGGVDELAKNGQVVFAPTPSATPAPGSWTRARHADRAAPRPHERSRHWQKSRKEEPDMFVALEGIDGSGKTTWQHARAVFDHIRHPDLVGLLDVSPETALLRKADAYTAGEAGNQAAAQAGHQAFLDHQQEPLATLHEFADAHDRARLDTSCSDLETASSRVAQVVLSAMQPALSSVPDS
jgi:hypothetical protein